MSDEVLSEGSISEDRNVERVQVEVTKCTQNIKASRIIIKRIQVHAG
jgi:hypothetical protein